MININTLLTDLGKTMSLFRTKQFPFDLPLSDGLLHCQKLVEAAPGKWLLIAGLWKEKAVLAKIFVAPISGWLQFNHELRGAQALSTAGIPSPTMIYAGHIKKSAAFIILFEPLKNATTLQQSFKSPMPRLERLALIRQLVQMIAKQHQAGIYQSNLQLKDFLVAHNVLYIISSPNIRVRKKPLSIQTSLYLFASLLAELDSIDLSLKTEVISWYFQSRHWPFDTKFVDNLHAQKLNWQKKREKKLQSQIFQSSTKFVVEKTPQCFWVCDRAYLTDELETFLKTPEYLFLTQNMRIIKEDATTTVGIIQISHHSLLVKRYNIKNFGHRLKRLVTKTRAKKSWVNAHRLLFHGFNTPKPIAMIEKRHGIFRGVCYLITEYVPGTTANEYFKPHHLDLTRGRLVAKQISYVLQNLVTKRIFHGDLKATNILVSETGIWLLDLDATRFYHSHFYFHRKAQKDRARFMRNWQGQPMIRNLF